jgi:transcriptional regulator with XRE-family HTH domain
MLEVILKLIDSSGIPDSEIEQKLSIPRSTIYDWRKGRSRSYKKYAIELAEFFGVSIDYILGKTNIKKEPDTNKGVELTTEQQEIMNLIMRLNPEQLKGFRAFLDTMFPKDKA